MRRRSTDDFPTWNDLDYALLFPNDEDMPDEWEPHLADGTLRTKPTHGRHDDPTADVVLDHLDRPVTPTPTEDAGA